VDSINEDHLIITDKSSETFDNPSDSDDTDDFDDSDYESNNIEI